MRRCWKSVASGPRLAQSGAAPVNRLSDATQVQDVTDDDESDFAACKEWRATSDRERPLPSSLSLMMTRQ